MDRRYIEKGGWRRYMDEGKAKKEKRREEIARRWKASGWVVK